MAMSASEQTLRRLLDYLEPRVDPEHATAVASLHQAVLDYEPVPRLPLVCYVPYEGQDFVPYAHGEIHTDPAKMMVNELLTGFTSIYHAVDLRDDAPYCLRPNFGVTIIASMLGAQIRIMDDQPPWVIAFDDRQKIREIVDAPPPELSAGLLPRVLAQYDFYRQMLTGYPNCEAAFQLTLPDLQGPFDTADMIWGNDIFMSFFDDLPLLEAFLMRISDTIVRVRRRLEDEVRQNLRPGIQYQHAVGVRGEVLLRDDTVIMLSPRHYRDHVRPHDAHVASSLGSVAIHFCGNGQHQVSNMLAMPGFTGFDFGQSWMMDIAAIYAQSAPQKVPLLRVRLPDEELTAAQAQQRFPTGVILTCEPESVAAAQMTWQRYLGGG